MLYNEQQREHVKGKEKIIVPKPKPYEKRKFFLQENIPSRISVWTKQQDYFLSFSFFYRHHLRHYFCFHSDFSL